MVFRRYRAGDENRVRPFTDAQRAAFPWLVKPWVRWFRYEVHGIEHVPHSGPGIVITPHSYMTIDGPLLSHAIFQHTGRIPHGLGDHLLFQIPVVRSLFVSLGVLDGTPANARRVLDAGELAFVMPGGGREAFRSSFRRYELLWDGHYGFVRAALRSGAPLIPSVCIGADDAAFLPIDALEWGKRLLGLRVPIMPAIGLGPLPFPVKLTAYVHPPIRFEEGPEAADDEEVVERLHARVVDIVKGMIADGLAARKSLFR